MEGFIEIKEVCEIFHIKERTVFRWIKKGMPSHRKEEGPGNRYLFLESEVRSWFTKPKKKA